MNQLEIIENDLKAMQAESKKKNKPIHDVEYRILFHFKH